MDNDIVPALLEEIQNEFDKRTYNSKKLKKALLLLQNKKATYLDANNFAIEIGEILSDVLRTTITAEVLPDGKMYFNIADRILNPTMKKNYDLISNFIVDVQTELNRTANLRLKGQIPEFNQDRIDGIVNRISSEEDFESIKWLLGDPIINFSQSIVDDGIKANAEFHAKAGLHPQITRKVSGHACEWCRRLAGTYGYYEAPKEVYQRHERCRCMVDYNPGNGRKQDVWSKTWTDVQKQEKINARKRLNLRKEK
ncbi:hypothetical protein OSF83_002528 [Enterococcus hirae]|nr:hypothetical protein [Enterococcus hirae]EMF0144700.1 hypothetical protein [Enterococcus hirae]EMF0282728.1 hypothetical protein [Enterococcus hirae]EMF0296445.1 hypothetical protein [Enterococcus hirae]EMF0503728.1 hypothetical protein [Enterococcus hirae]